MKTKRKWIVLNWNSDGCLRAEDIPYNSAESIKDKIDSFSKAYNFTLTIDGEEYSQIIDYEEDLGQIEYPIISVWVNNRLTDIVIDYINNTSIKLTSNEELSGKVRISR